MKSTRGYSVRVRLHSSGGSSRNRTLERGVASQSPTRTGTATIKPTIKRRRVMVSGSILGPARGRNRGSGTFWPAQTSGFAVRPRSLGWSARRIQARLQAERRGRPLHPTLRTKRGATLDTAPQGRRLRSRLWRRSACSQVPLAIGAGGQPTVNGPPPLGRQAAVRYHGAVTLRL